MALTLVDMYTLTIVEADFRKRIDAAVAETAIIDLQNPAPSGNPTLQQQRMSLVKDIMLKRNFYTDTFGWYVSTSPSNVSVDTITDNAILINVQANFDAVAALVYP